MNALANAQTAYDSMEQPDQPAPIDISSQQLYETMAAIWVVGGRDAIDFDDAIVMIYGTILNGAGWCDDGLVDDMADCWGANDGDAHGFIVCRGEIRGWIVAEMMIRGKFNRRAA